MIKQYRENILVGSRCMKHFRKKYGRKTLFVLPMFPGTGDVYYLCKYVKSFAEKRGYEQLCVLVIGMGCKRVLDLFPDIQGEAITKDEAAAIEYYRIFREDTGIHLFHYDLPVFREPFMIGKKIRGYKGIHFFDLLYRSGFEGEVGLKTQEPVFQKMATQKYIEENNVIKGSILLSPYAKSMTKIPETFWENLVESFIKQGKKVYTNCAVGEKPIKGTVGLTFDFSISKFLLDYCGTYVGLRSGFTDIISSSTCKKIVLYPKYFEKGCGNSLDCYSLKYLYNDYDAIELEYDENTIIELSNTTLEMIDEICKYV